MSADTKPAIRYIFRMGRSAIVIQARVVAARGSIAGSTRVRYH